MKFLNPVTGIRDEKLPDRSRILPIEIDRIAPFVFFLANQIIIGENSEIISVGPEMVVNDVENYGEA